MPIGLVSDSELETEVTNSDSLTIEELKRGRGEQRQVPGGLRKLISGESIEHGNGAGKELARAFNISDSSVSAYKNGSTSTASYDEPNQALTLHNKEVKVKVARKAHKTLLSAIKHITEDKLVDAGPKELSGVAKDLASVVRVMEPEVETQEESVKFIFYAPPMRDEKDFDVIDIVE